MTKYVVVHLRDGFVRLDSMAAFNKEQVYNPKPANRILEYLKDKKREDIVLLCQEIELQQAEKLSKLYGIPITNMHLSQGGRLFGSHESEVKINLPEDYFKGQDVEVMGYQYDPTWENKRCVNKAIVDLRKLTRKHPLDFKNRVKVLEDKVNTLTQ